MGRRGQDASAKSNARNLLGMVEACSTEKNDYTTCDSLAELTAGGDKLGFVYGSAPGQGEVANAKSDSYDVIAHSTSGNDFTISRDKNGAVTRTCATAGTADRLVNASGGRATARAIPGARLLKIEGMGHDLPRGAWPQLIDAIVENAGHAVSATPAGDRQAV